VKLRSASSTRQTGLLLGALLLGACRGDPALPAYPTQAAALSLHPDSAGWQLLAVEYARSPHAPLSVLDPGAAPDATIALSWSFFVAAGHGHVALVDAGTDALSTRQAPADSWRSVKSLDVARARSVPAALAAVGLAPADVTDVVLTHHHWDHVEGLVDLPRATVHVHADEWAALLASPLLDPALRPAMVALADSGRVHGFSGDHSEPLPGLSIRAFGSHTPHHSVVELRCAEGPVVVAGDAAYAYADLGEAAALESAGRLLLGHDPLLYSRWPSPQEGVAQICAGR